MAVYRVVNEMGHVEAEYPVYSAAKEQAEKFHQQGNRTGHYRVEEVSIVYHTAIKLTVPDQAELRGTVLPMKNGFGQLEEKQ